MRQKPKEYPQVIRIGRITIHGKLPSEGLQGEFVIVTCVMIEIMDIEGVQKKCPPKDHQH